MAQQVDETTFRLTLRPRRHHLDPNRAATVTERSNELPEDITVTASKRSERAGNLPLSLSIIVPSSLPSGGRDSDGVIAAAESVVSTNLGPGRNRIFLRGVADSAFSGPTQSTVSLFLDEARVSYANPDPDLKMIDIDRVEILRGPQGSLYGTGALGGIIRIVTTPPDFDRWSGLIASYATTVSHGGIGGGGDAVLNAPLVRDRLALRLVAYSEVIPGWIDNLGTGQSDANRVLRSGGRATLAWVPVEGWRASIGATGQWINTRDSQYSDGSGEYSKRTALAEPHDNDFIVAHGDIAGTIGKLDLEASAAYVAHEVASIYDAASVAATYGLPAPLGYHEDSNLHLWSGELRVSEANLRHPWLVGLSYLSANSVVRGRMEASQASKLIRDDEDRDQEIAIFGEATQPVLRHLDLRLGMRAFTSTGSNERSLGTDRSNRRVGVTPSVTLAWQPRDGANLWLRYASAIRPGGLTGTTTPATFKSDKLESVEAGWKVAFGHSRLVLSGAIFGYRWKNLQSDVLGSDGFISTINAGTAHDFGIEAGALYGIGIVRLEASVTVQQARLDTPVPGRGDDRRLPVVPDTLAHANMRLPFRIAGLAGEASLSGRFIGRSRLSFDPLLDRRTALFATIDSGVSLGRDHWKVSLDATNLLDADGNSFAFGNPFTLRATPQRTPTRPRMVTLRMERNF